jgi:hypothetical protein
VTRQEMVNINARISKPEENFLKRKYGSVNKGIAALIHHARTTEAPPPFYPKKALSKRPVKPVDEKPRFKELVFDEAAIRAIQEAAQ